MIKALLIVLPEEIHWKVKQKCKFNEVTMQHITATLLEKFSKGEFDILLSIKNPKRS